MKLFLLIFTLFTLQIFVKPVFAIVDPFSVTNNKFGIHIISATSDEINPASDLVNSNDGDWGYITVLIESKDRDKDKWQKVFDIFREKHLIPLIRLATSPEGSYWKRPYDGEEIAWADFLDNLNWPTKNRYVIIYNEPNHAQEWGGQVDPADYALTLDKTIKALKKKSEDFFVLNAGFDASASEKHPSYANQYTFMSEMDQAVPGIFNTLDGWVSHSYPNPEFSASPYKSGRGSIRTWEWELDVLADFGVSKDLPVFITETGWKHAEGKVYNPNYPASDTVAKYFQTAFTDIWYNPKIAAVTPFLLNYQESPFDHFSFKKYSGANQEKKLLGLEPLAYAAENPDYYPQYQAVKDLPKNTGAPVQEFKAELTKGEVYPAIVSNESYTLTFTFKNTGQSIWNDKEQVTLIALEGGKELSLNPVSVPYYQKIKPQEEYTFVVRIKAPIDGSFKVVLNLFADDKEFSNQRVDFYTVVKAPVLLKIQTHLKWKQDSSGNYLLYIVGMTGEKISSILLDAKGELDAIEAKYLPPDLIYTFTLEKPLYKPKTIQQKLKSGLNVLDFGELQPDITSAILKPQELWQLLPFSD